MRKLAKIPLNIWVISIFIIINVGLYYPRFQSLITLSYILLLIGFILDLANKKSSRYLEFGIKTFLFLLFSYFSLIWAASYTYGYGHFIILLKSVVPVLLISAMIHSKEDFITSLKVFSFAAFLYTLLFIPLVDLSELADSRVADAMTADEFTPNVNVISMCSSFACVLFAFWGITEKKIGYFILAIASFIFTVILGSRKSLLSVILFLFILFFKTRGRDKSKLIVYAFLTLLIVFAVIPYEYLEFIIERFGIFDFFMSGNTMVVDESDNNRIEMLTHGVNYFSNKPLLGNGFMNFAILFNRDGYMLTYAHNNFIELLADLGLVGFFLYYLPYISIYTNSRKSNGQWAFLFKAILIVILFNSLFIVFISTRFMWLLIALLSVGSYYCKYDKR